MYIGYQNGKIKFYVEEIPTPIECYQGVEWVVTQDEYVLDGDEYVPKDEAWEEKQAQAEQDRINNLTMTALDFIGVLQNVGLTLEEINAYLEANLALKMQLTYCQNVYCGVVRQLLPLKIGEVTITDDMVIRAFRVKNEDEVVNGAGEGSDDELTSNAPADDIEESEEVNAEDD